MELVGQTHRSFRSSERACSHGTLRFALQFVSIQTILHEHCGITGTLQYQFLTDIIAEFLFRFQLALKAFSRLSKLDYQLLSAQIRIRDHAHV